MVVNRELKDFLKDNRISDEVWQKSECNWDSLQAIAEHYEKSIDELNRAAEWIAQKIQKVKLVHSVRWRVKNSEHLLEKIIRKRADEEEKYNNISVENYQEIVTDLVGIRALHLFKEDCFEIDNELRKNSIQMMETPVAYLRNGDTLAEKFFEHGFDVKYKKSGYRSIHYLWLAPFADLTVIVEIQIRTIFEEGWSEIDHKIRYPNFSDEPLVVHFLNIFNQIAGNADEIGGFLLWLNSHIENSKNKFNQITQESEEKESAICELDRIISSLKVENDEDKKTIENLKIEIQKLKNTSNPIHIDLQVSEALSDINDSNSTLTLKEKSTKNIGLLDSLNKPNFDEISRTSIANSAANAFNQYKEELTKNANGGLLSLGLLNFDEINKTSITNSAVNAFDQYKNDLTKNINGGLLGLGRLNIDEMSKVSTIADATKLHLHKEGLLGSALGLNDLNPLNKFKEDIAKTQKLAAGGMIGSLNNPNTFPKCLSKMQLSQCPICGFSR